LSDASAYQNFISTCRKWHITYNTTAHLPVADLFLWAECQGRPDNGWHLAGISPIECFSDYDGVIKPGYLA
jgi:hypothetical protein